MDHSPASSPADAPLPPPAPASASGGKRFRRLLLAFPVLWTLLIGAAYWWNEAHIRKTVEDLASIAARSSFDKDLLYRRWASMHGGVYVPVTGQTPPSPYLADVPERDITTPSGRRLTLMNPAYMTRQVHELGRQFYRHRGHVTSLTPIRPENAPDAWERKALEAFERGVTEVSSIEPYEGAPHLRLMRPLSTETGCLKCHARQGYQTGDIRGGLAVNVPIADYEAIVLPHQQAEMLAHAGIWILGIVLLAGGGWQIRQRRLERLSADAARRADEGRLRAMVEEARERNRFIEAILEHAPIGFAVNTIHDGKAQFIGSRFEEIYGLSRGSLHSVEDFFERVYRDPVFREQIQTRIVADISSGDPARMRWEDIPLASATGETRFITATNIPLLDQDLMVSTVQDVTERHRAVEALRASEALYHDLVETSQDLIWQCDVEGRYSYLNPAWETTLGYRLDEMLGRPFTDFQAPEYAGRDRALFARLLGGEAVRGHESVHVRKDGRPVHLVFNAKCVRDEQGRPGGTRGTAYDITERRQAQEEQQRLQSQLIQAQKIDAIGQLAGGIAHDFNNILTGIMMQLGLLQDQADPELSASLTELEVEVRRATDLTRQLLLFSRRQVMQIQTFDLNSLLGNLLRMLRRLIGEHVALEFSGVPGDLLVEADPGMLEQVVMNLVVNARDAMPRGGRVTIATESEAVDADHCARNSEARPGSFVRLTVADTGCGMDDGTLQRIYEPFFTTKEAGKGTGLGLATVHGIVKQHGGWIEVDSAPGRGTTFRVYLPALPAGPAEGERPAADEQALPGGTETILLVEDADAVRRTTAAVLRRLGYRVLEAATSSEALALWATERASVALLLTDMVMPGGMTGLELTERLRADEPSLRCLLVSGYSRELADTGISPRQDIAFLAKPLAPATLARKLRACLDGR